MVEALKEEILRLITEDRSFRLAIAGALGLADTMEEIRELRRETAENTRTIRTLQEQVAENTKAIRALQEQVAENTKAIRALQEQVAEHSKILAEHSAAIKALQEQVADHAKVLAEHSKMLAEHSSAIKALQEQVGELARSVRSMSRTIAAIGARWGLLAEEAFRDAMRDIVERLFGGRVERWVYFDEEGSVFGHPSIVEVDLVVRDSEHVLVEVKSSASKADIYELANIGKLYEKVKKVKPRLAIVSPFVEPKALKVAKEIGVEVYTGIALEE